MSSKKIQILLSFCCLMNINFHLLGMELHTIDPYSPQAIIANPLACLEKINPLKEKFFAGSDLLNFKEYEKQCPIFLLCECSPLDLAGCLLGRSKNFLFRGDYEKKVSEQAIKIMNNSLKEELNFLSFASGDLFQDLVIIAKILDKKPSVILNINLIDIQYAPYIDILKKKNNSQQQIRVEREFDLEYCTQEYSKIKTAAWTKKDADNIYRIMLQQALFIQFKKWLNLYCEKKNIVRVFSSVNDYWFYRNNYICPLPDLIAAADIYSSADIRLGSSEDFNNLVKKTMEENSQIKVVVLLTEGNCLTF